MTENRPKRIAIVLAVLLVLYVGTYYAVVGRARTRHNVRGVFVSDDTRAYYSFDEQSDRRWGTFFAPVHWIDRHIRTSFWNPPPEE
jgi:hypothetical protein